MAEGGARRLQHGPRQQQREKQHGRAAQGQQQEPAQPQAPGGAPLGEHEEPDGGEIQTRLPPALQQVDRDRDRDREGGQQVQRREQPERHRGQPSRRAR